jgi:nucleoside-diphosphate-sugar epimerase
LARALIVGCGCHGRELGVELAEAGWQVRGTSRRPEGLEAIEAAGLEPAVADPDLAGTVLEHCGDVAAVVWLLGSATGEPEASAANGPRLQSLLEKLVDSPVRGFVYESAGSLPGATLGEGARIVGRAGERWRIPVTLLREDRGGPGWARDAARKVAGLLAG